MELCNKLNDYHRAKTSKKKEDWFTPLPGSTSFFMELPPELRLEIYKYLLPAKKGRSANASSAARGWHSKYRALMETNTALYTEVRPVIFESSFKLRLGPAVDRSDAIRFFELFVGKENVRLLKRVLISETNTAREVLGTVEIEIKAKGKEITVVSKRASRSTDRTGEIKSLLAGMMETHDGSLTVEDWIKVYDEVAQLLAQRWWT